MSKTKSVSTLAVKGVREITITIPNEKLEERNKLVAACAGVLAINNADDLEKAVAAVAPLKLLARDAEKDRKEFKAPILDAGALIDSTVKEFVKPVAIEVNRIETVIAEYNRKVFAAAQAEQRRRDEEAAQIERERQAEVRRIQAEQAEADRKAAEAAKAGDKAAAAEAQAAQDRLAQEELAAELRQTEAAPLPQIVTNTKVQGAAVRTEYDFEVTDIAALYLHFPHLVELTIKARDTKAFINIDNPNVDRNKIPGLRVFEKTTVSVRAAKAAPQLEA